jgi:hypothetical protein
VSLLYTHSLPRSVVQVVIDERAWRLFGDAGRAALRALAAAAPARGNETTPARGGADWHKAKVAPASPRPPRPPLALSGHAASLTPY